MTDTQTSEEELADIVEAAFSPADERDERFRTEQAAARERAAREFIITKQHRRFAEFCDAVRRDRYIGLCYGPPGVGKTLSARRYTHWDIIGPYLDHWRYLEYEDAPPEMLEHKAILYTPKIHNTPRIVDKDLCFWHDRLSWTVEGHLHHGHNPVDLVQSCGPYAELLIVDEADRLKTPSLEAPRDHHDRTGIGLILIGMPGIERGLARYPQLYSRVGFLHHYQPPAAAQQPAWRQLNADPPGDGDHR